MVLHIVAAQQVINEFKKSNFFKRNLGLVQTLDKNGRRIYNDKDKFSYFYNTQYRTAIYAQGNIGNMKFYVDHMIRDLTFAVYYDNIGAFEEFLFTLDINVIKEKGLDFYTGHILKRVDEMYEERVKNNELKKQESEKSGNPDMIFKNPGGVTYADIKAYLEKKNKERYKN